MHHSVHAMHPELQCCAVLRLPSKPSSSSARGGLQQPRASRPCPLLRHKICGSALGQSQPAARGRLRGLLGPAQAPGRPLTPPAPAHPTMSLLLRRRPANHNQVSMGRGHRVAFPDMNAWVWCLGQQMIVQSFLWQAKADPEAAPLFGWQEDSCRAGCGKGLNLV